MVVDFRAKGFYSRCNYIDPPEGDIVTNHRPLTVKVYRTWDELEELAGRWNQFLVDCDTTTLCLTWEWLASWWAAYHASRELFVLGLFDAGGALAGIAPLYRTGDPKHTRTRFPLRVVRFIGTGTGGASTNLGFISRPGSEATVTGSVLDWLSQSRSAWDVLDLHLMRSELQSTKLLIEELDRRKWLQSRSQQPHRIAKLPNTYQAYLATLSKKMRTELPYEHRRLLKNFEVKLRRVEKDDDLPQAIETLMRLNTQRWRARGEPGSFANPEKRSFCVELARRFLACGWLDFWILELDGIPAAMEFGFRLGGTFYPLWVALDTQFKAYSPGAVLKALILQELIRDGVQEYEFMQGSEPYKLRWGAHELLYDTTRCARPYSWGAVYFQLSALQLRGRAFVQHPVAPLKRLLGALLPEPIRLAIKSRLLGRK